MTPDKILDLGVKLGVVPFLFYMVIMTRQDVDELQDRLQDCYEERLSERTNPDNQKKMPNKLIAVLPNELKIKKIKRNA